MYQLLNHGLGLVLFLAGLPIMLRFGVAVARYSVGFRVRALGLAATGLVSAVVLAIVVFLVWGVVHSLLVWKGVFARSLDDYSPLIELLAAPFLYVAAFWIGTQQRSAKAVSVGSSAQEDYYVPVAGGADLRSVAAARSTFKPRFPVALFILVSPIASWTLMYALSGITGVEVGGMGSTGFPRLLFALSLWATIGWVYAIPLAALVFAISWLSGGPSNVERTSK